MSDFQCPPLPNIPPRAPWILDSNRRVDSPTPLVEIIDVNESDGELSAIGVLSEATFLDIVNGVRRFTHSSTNSTTDSFQMIDCPEGSTGGSVTQDDISRKLLVIGSNYTRGCRRTFSISSAITLEGAVGDKNVLRETFVQRGYSASSMVNDIFDQNDALNKVSQFVSTARCGDVRAIVFTGHAISTEMEASPAIIPPNCPTRELAIPAQLWEDTIRASAKPGVVVLSIFASCFSGGFMQQPISMQNLDTLTINEPGAYSQAGPILVTFSSASPDQLSYESSIEHTDPWRVADHFLHAFARTVQLSQVNNWESFVSTLESEFQAARDIGASFDPDRTPEEWKSDSPQTPMLTASSLPVSTNFFEFPTPSY